MRDADAVEHIHEPGYFAIGHVGVPVLTGIGTADVFAILFQVREDANLRVLARGMGIADRAPLDLAEKFREPLQRRKVETLVREAQYLVAAEHQQDPPHVARD